MSIPVCATCAVESEKTLRNTKRCCGWGEIKARTESLLRSKQGADQNAMARSMEVEKLKTELETANAQTVELKKQLDELQEDYKAITLELEKTNRLLDEKRVEIDAVETAQAIRGINLNKPLPAEMTRNPCIIFYSDKGLRKLKRGKPEVDLYMSFAGQVVFAESVCRKGLTILETLAGVSAYLENHPGTEAHVICHLGRAEIKSAVLSEKPLTVDDIAASIINPLAELRAKPGVLSVTWCTMIEPKTVPNAAAVNKAILSSPIVQTAEVQTFDLRILSGDERNLSSHEDDILEIQYADNVLKTLYNWFHSHIVAMLKLSPADLGEIEKQRDEYKIRLSEREEKRKEVQQLIDTKKRVLKNAIRELEQTKAPPCSRCQQPDTAARSEAHASSSGVAPRQRKRQEISPRQPQYPKRWRGYRGAQQHGPHHAEEDDEPRGRHQAGRRRDRDDSRPRENARSREEPRQGGERGHKSSSNQVRFAKSNAR